MVAPAVTRTTAVIAGVPVVGVAARDNNRRDFNSNSRSTSCRKRVGVKW